MTTTQKVSATDFTDPLLQALGKLSGHQAEHAVPMKDTYQPIMDLMGIDSVDAHGFQDPSTKKRPLVLRQIGWAYRNARVPSKDGTEPAYTIAGARGKWSLTLAGVTRARELNGEPVEDHVALAFAIVEADDNLELDQAVQNISAFTSFGALLDSTQDTGYVPTLNAEPSDDRYNDSVLVRDAIISRGIEVHPPALLAVVVDEETVVVDEISELGDGNQLPVVNGIVYHSDPYIVSLASKQTQCFGSFSPRSNVCGRCPLQGACLNVVRGKLAELAKGFTAKLNAPDDDDTYAILAAAYGEGEVEEPAPPVRDPEWDKVNETSSLIKEAGSDGKCYRCGGVIPKNSKAWWSREAGLYHEECH